MRCANANLQLESFLVKALFLFCLIVLFFLLKVKAIPTEKYIFVPLYRKTQQALKSEIG